MHRARLPLRSRSVLAAVAAVAVSSVLAACASDGRTLRPARADQMASVSTLSPSTTLEPAFTDGDDGGFTDLDGDGIDDALQASTSETTETFATLPVEQTATTVGAGGTTVVPAPDDTSDLPVVTDTPIGSSDLPPGPGEDIGGDAAVLTGPWAQSEPFDPLYTCDGDNNSPPLTWSPAPEGTAEIAITMTDNDAPDFIHWVMAGLDPSRTSLEEAEVPEGAIVGTSSVGGNGYWGPCPSPGDGLHHYVITVHFLATQTELESGVDGADLITVVYDATINGASLVGTYERN